MKARPDMTKATGNSKRGLNVSFEVKIGIKFCQLIFECVSVNNQIIYKFS